MSRIRRARRRRCQGRPNKSLAVQPDGYEDACHRESNPRSLPVMGSHVTHIA